MEQRRTCPLCGEGVDEGVERRAGSYHVPCADAVDRIESAEQSARTWQERFWRAVWLLAFAALVILVQVLGQHDAAGPPASP